MKHFRYERMTLATLWPGGILLQSIYATFHGSFKATAVVKISVHKSTVQKQLFKIAQKRRLRLALLRPKTGKRYLLSALRKTRHGINRLSHAVHSLAQFQSLHAHGAV